VLANLLRSPRLVLIAKFYFKGCQIGLLDKCADVCPWTGDGETATDKAI